MSADQPIVAGRVAEMGAGKQLDKDTLTAELLHECVNELLHEETYLTASSKIGVSLRAAGGQRKALEHIRKFKVDHGITN
ncbi:hypothetical protein D3C85_1826120 [compost metagenome]